MIGARLKEERSRIGLTQPAFAELAGAKKRTLIDWENGVSSPTAVQIAALAAHGVDVLYVLTGQRLPPGTLPATTPPLIPPPVLSADELALLADYRASHPVVKRSTRAALREAASSSGGEVATPPRRRKRA